MDDGNGSRAKPAAGGKNGLKLAEPNAKEIPKDSFSRRLLVTAHEQSRAVAEQYQLRNGKLEKGLNGKREPAVSNVDVSTVADPENLFPSSSLEPIYLPQLELGKRHYGRCLSGAFCVRPFRVSPTAVMSVLADRSGKAVRVSIVSSQFASISTAHIDALFASGRDAIIKEPYLKISPADGNVMILVENSEDLGLVDISTKEIVTEYEEESVIESKKEIERETEAVLQELDKMRAVGNHLFAQQRWLLAIEEYSRCIARGNLALDGGRVNKEKINHCLLLAFSNRSQVWLLLANYKNALDDANKALEFDPNHQKSIYRRDKARREFGKVEFPSNKAKVHVEDTNAPEKVRAADQEIVSKSKSKDVTHPAKTTASKVKPTKGNKRNPPGGPSAANGIGSKPVSPPKSKSVSKDRKSSMTTKVKDAKVVKNLFILNPHYVGNLSPPRDKSSPAKAAKATERKSIPPTPPKASKVKPVESRETNLAAPVTPTPVEMPAESRDTNSAARVTATPVEKPAESRDVNSDASVTSSPVENPAESRDTNSDAPVTATPVEKPAESGDTMSAPQVPQNPVEKPAKSRDATSAVPTTPPTKAKLCSVNADPPNTTKGELAVPTTREDDLAPAAPAVDSGRRSSDSENDSDSDSDSSSPERLEERKLTDADSDDAEDEYTVIERKPVTNSARSDSPVSSGSSSDTTVTVHSSTTDPQMEIMATGAIDNEMPSFAGWLDSIRSSADVLLSKGSWSDAVKFYNRVTGFSLPKRNRDKVIQTLLLAYSHRSEAWVWIGDFEKSLRDADSAIRIVENYPASVVGFEGKHFLNEVRRGRAFHGLGEYEKAIHVFKEALIKSPKEGSIIDLLKKSRIALEQSQKGVYDLDEFFVNGCRGPPPPCSDFVGPIEIRRVPGKGRGLFATKDVEAGDLLLVSNPLIIIHRTPNSHDEDYRHLTTKWRRNVSGSPVGLDEFVTRLSCLQTQKKVLQVYSLTAGKPEDEIEVPDISLFVPGTQFMVPQRCEGYAGDDGFHTLRRIAIRNAIEGGLNPLDGANKIQGFGDEDEVAVSIVGLWALPSFMNHSCVPNCHMIDIGSAMFVRASRTIQKGEELTRAYFDVYQNGLDRQRLCEEWGFVCDCERCILEKSLTAQRILPLHEYRKLLARAREESAKRFRFADERGRSLSLLLPNPQPALLQLRQFADWFDNLLNRAEGLGNKEKAWIGASHLEAYISRFQGSRDRNQYILALEIILEFMTNTAILAIGQTTESALARAAVLLAQVEDMYGTGSQTYRRIETRVLDLYQTAYGGLNKEVIFSMSRLMNSTPVR